MKTMKNEIVEMNKSATAEHPSSPASSPSDQWACSSIKKALPDRKVDYKQEKVAWQADLEIPPDLTHPSPPPTPWWCRSWHRVRRLPFLNTPRGVKTARGEQ